MAFDSPEASAGKDILSPQRGGGADGVPFSVLDDAMEDLMGQVEQRLDFGECRDLNETHRVSYLVPVLSEDGSSSEAYERCVLVAVPKDATPGSGGVVASTYLHFPSTLQAGDIDVGDGPRKRLVESAGDSNCIKFHFKIAAVGGLPAIDTRDRSREGGHKARWWTDLQGLQRLLENNKFTGPMGPGESGAQ